jgi:hypothetical protein
MKRTPFQRIARLALTIALSAWPVFVSTTAEAQIKPAFTLEKVSGAIGVRYGSNDLNLGVGALVGYTLPQSIYLGGVFDYWFGKSQDYSAFGVVQTAKSHGWNLFGEVGYDFGVLPALVLRPVLGAGVLHGDVEACTSVPLSPVVQCVSGSSSNAAGLFGGQLMYLVGSSVHVGGELRIIVADSSAVVFGGNVGLIF